MRAQAPWSADVVGEERGKVATAIDDADDDASLIIVEDQEGADRKVADRPLEGDVRMSAAHSRSVLDLSASREQFSLVREAVAGPNALRLRRTIPV